MREGRNFFSVAKFDGKNLVPRKGVIEFQSQYFQTSIKIAQNFNNWLLLQSTEQSLI